MILLADSGSTKTTWTFLEYRRIVSSVVTAGLNPYFLTSGEVDAILKNELVPHLPPGFVTEIHFYGAGCSTENNNNMLRDVMKFFFREASVSVYHDILGAARSLFGKDKGIACILGTGCNACYYDGEEVTSKVPSLGYLFGDEGAGSNLGKIFMEKYLKNKLPSEIKTEFDLQYKLSLEDILNALYNKPFLNRFLASFSEFISPHQDHPFFRDLVEKSFHSFIDEQIRKYDNYENLTISFVGSIAWYYKEILLETAAESRLHVGTILKSPMEGLIRYHVG